MAVNYVWVSEFPSGEWKLMKEGVSVGMVYPQGGSFKVFHSLDGLIAFRPELESAKRLLQKYDAEAYGGEKSLKS